MKKKSASPARPQSPRPPLPLPAPVPPSPNNFTGVWRYRSFLNDPQAVSDSDIGTILFAQGVFSLNESFGALTGTGDFGPGYTVTFTGVTSYGTNPSVRFQGKGSGPTNSDWLYDYFGWFAPAWPNGVGQVPAILGTIVRSAPHKPNRLPGEVASFIAVKIS